MRRYSIHVTTAADGTATTFTPRLSGELHSIHYEKGDFPNGVDFAITAEKTGENLWTEADVNTATARYPRAPTHGADGAPALFAADGTAVRARPALGNDRVKIAITQGGNVKSGTFHILVA
nr:hypothetical protein [Sphingomonas sp. Y57]